MLGHGPQEPAAAGRSASEDLRRRQHGAADSRGGAKLHVSYKEWLPNTFEIADPFSSTRRTVRVVWVGQTGVGVRFIDEDPSAMTAKSKTFGRRQP